jgi:Ca-activated chloride channel family protein
MGGQGEGQVRVFRLALFIALLVLPRGLPGQTDSAKSPTISVDVNLVVLPATVRDQQGQFVSGLQKDDFRVFENHQPQQIRLFQQGDVPVSAGLLVDDSASMESKRKDVLAAALAFVKSSNPQDQMFVVDFNDKIALGLPNTELFSTSASELEAALNGVPARGRTALYDAIEAGLNHLKRASRDKKVLIAITDGGDNASHHKLKEVLEDAARSNVMIYAIGLIDEHNGDQNPGFLRKITRITGGEAFFPGETSDIATICTHIAEDIRRQYTIGYVPTAENLDNAYRSIRVTARDLKHGRLLVRTRAGYIAAAHGASQAAEAKIP